MSDEDKREVVKAGEKLTKELAIATTGAITGTVIAGPAGALIGGAIGPVANFLIEVNEQRVSKIQTLLEEGAAFSKLSLDEFLDRIRRAQGLSELAARVVAASVLAGSVQHLHAYAAILSRAEATVGEVSFAKYLPMVGILEEMQEPHFDVLTYIANECAHRDFISPDDIVRQFPGYVAFIRSIVRTLELHGLILDETRLTREATPLVKWVPSELGLAVSEIIAAGGLKEESPQ